jgi:hypothetical protein
MKIICHMAPLRSPDWSCDAASPNHRRVTDCIGLEKTMAIVFFGQTIAIFMLYTFGTYTV